METPSTAPWSFIQKLLFRYLFVFFGLIIFPFPLNIIPGLDSIWGFYDQFWTYLINLAGGTFFGVEKELTLSFTGSGDKLYDWLWYFCAILLTIIIGTIWSIIDRNRQSYGRLQTWLTLFVTYYLGYFLLVYGIIKLFYLQFIPPNMERLFQTFGQASPMRLLWTFMGFSKTYTVFSGFCETLAGFLILIRNTRTLGALAAIGVMLNVFMLNMSYDVPVKLFSFQLMMMGVYLALVDGRRLMAFFLLNQPVQPAKSVVYFKNKMAKRVLLGLQILLIGFIVYSQITRSLEGQKQFGSKRAKSLLYGAYHVNTFVLNNDTLAPLTTDTVRWNKVLFDFEKFTSIILMNDHVIRYDSKIDTIEKTISFSPRGDTINQYPFLYTVDSIGLHLTGVIESDTLNIFTKKYDLDNFGLLNRGFNWVNEVPYNRYNYD